MKFLMAIVVLLAVNFSWASVGSVSDSKGTACSIERDKKKLGGEKGAGIESMDTYITAACSANITFKDDTKVKVTENSRLLIDDFVYDPKQSDAGKLAMKVTMGTVRYASGQIAKNNPQQVNVKTPTASIAVRGTDFTMTVDETGESLVVLLPSCKDDKDVKQYELQENKCLVGSIEVRTNSGVVILDKAFEATYIASNNSMPTTPRVLNITENKISNLLILVKPTEIAHDLKAHEKAKKDKEKELELEAALEYARAEQARQEAEAYLLAKMRVTESDVCDAVKTICVRWQNPEQQDLNLRGGAVAYRNSPDHYAEVKTQGIISNTSVTIVHNDAPASLVIGDPTAILNSVYIKQNVGVIRTR
jgi:hypothetical protein